MPDAALHRYRHTAAVNLVAEGLRLAAPHRLGPRDLPTTGPKALDDADVADYLVVSSRGGPEPTQGRRPSA